MKYLKKLKMLSSLILLFFTFNQIASAQRHNITYGDSIYMKYISNKDTVESYYETGFSGWVLKYRILY